MSRFSGVEFSMFSVLDCVVVIAAFWTLLIWFKPQVLHGRIRNANLLPTFRIDHILVESEGHVSRYGDGMRMNNTREGGARGRSQLLGTISRPGLKGVWFMSGLS